MHKDDAGRCEVAYLCFLFTVMVILATYIFANVVPPDSGDAWVLGLFVLPALYLGAFITTVTGIIHSVRLWRHWPLPLLSVLMVLSLVVWVAALAFILASIVLALIWFLGGPRRVLARESIF